MAYYDRKLELDGRTFVRSETALARALVGGQFLTRPEIGIVLRRAGIEAEGQRLAHLAMHSELEQVICSGPRRGRQFTYALLDERAPHARRLERDAAVAELSRRYFTGHGPATVRDFVWWSGLTVRDAKQGLDRLRSSLSQHRVGDLTYWRIPVAGRLTRAVPRAFLFPNYDEFLIAYKDRGLAEPSASRPTRDVFAHHVLLDGRLAGSWQRTIISGRVSVEIAAYRRPTAAEAGALEDAAARYGRFLGVPATMSIRLAGLGANPST